MPVDVRQIDGFIRAIEEAYQASVHVEAYNYLKQAEKTQNEEEKREFEAAAIRLWEKHLAEYPQDYTTSHHLAILYHSHAWELEQAGKVREAAPLWKKALTHWARVWQAKAFWQEQTEKMVDLATEGKGFGFFLTKFQILKDNLPRELQDETAARQKWDEALAHWYLKEEIPPWWEPYKSIGIPLGGVDLEKFRLDRQGLPRDLLKIHFTLVLHYNALGDGGRLRDARSHFDLLREADFPRKIIQEFRAELGRSLLTTDREAIKVGRRYQEGIAEAKRLLEIDPENIFGLESLLLSYHIWNQTIRPQETLTALRELEENMRTISSGRYVEKLKKAIGEEGCPVTIADAARETLENLNWPIITLCKALYFDNYQGKLQFLTVREKEEVVTILNNLLRYGADDLESSELRNIRSLRDALNR